MAQPWLVTSVSGKFHLFHKLWFCFTPCCWLLLCQASSICPTSRGSVSLPGYFCVRQVPSVPQAVVLFHSLVTSVSGESHLSHKPWFCFTPWLLLWQASSICPTSRGSISLPGYFCDRQVPSVPQAVVLFHSLVTSVTGKTHLSHKPWFCFTPSYWRGRDHDDRENDVIPSDTPEGPHIEPVCDALADYTAVRLELHINVSTWSHLFPPPPPPTLPPSPSHKINF